MSVPIRVRVGDLQLDGYLNDTDCARAIAKALPLEARFAVWGDEFYFTIPVEHGLEREARTNVAVGDLGYWPEGNALCIFFGPTPMSSGEEPVAAGPVNVVGAVGNAEALRGAKGAQLIVVEAAG